MRFTLQKWDTPLADRGRLRFPWLWTKRRDPGSMDPDGAPPRQGGMRTMTASMRVMSAGDGYRYLLKGVATGDRDRRDPNPLVGYFTEEGNPPGRWLGSGVHAFGDGQIK